MPDVRHALEWLLLAALAPVGNPPAAIVSHAGNHVLPASPVVVGSSQAVLPDSTCGQGPRQHGRSSRHRDGGGFRARLGRHRLGR